MEQTGFQPDQKPAYHGARHGWPRFLARLEQVLARLGNGVGRIGIDP
jgi:hypothetical protein